MTTTCGICGGAMLEIRSRYPGQPQRQVCPTCLADIVDQIRDITSPNYGIAVTAAPIKEKIEP